jgi:hypothetical protein
LKSLVEEYGHTGYHLGIMKLHTFYRVLKFFGPASLLLFVASAVQIMAQNNEDEEEWIQLFNGKDLQGWDVKISGHDLNDNYGDTFRVEDGVLKVVYDHYRNFDDKFGHLFYREKFSHYLLAVEYRFVGEGVPGTPDWLSARNSGVMIHSQSAQSMGKHQDFPVSVETQLLGGTGSGETSTANLCPLGTVVEINGSQVTEDCLRSNSKTYHGEQWVRVEVKVLGGSLTEHMVEGDVVLTYKTPRILEDERHHFDPTAKKDETVLKNGMLLEEGYIALQSESHPVEFRKVELLNLAGCTDPKASNYKSYYVKSENSRCQYRTPDEP